MIKTREVNIAQISFSLHRKQFYMHMAECLHTLATLRVEYLLLFCQIRRVYQKKVDTYTTLCVGTLATKHCLKQRDANMATGCSCRNAH